MAHTTFIVKLYNGRKGVVHFGENGSFAVDASKYNHLRAIVACSPTESVVDFFIKMNISDLEDPRNDVELRVHQIKKLIFADAEIYGRETTLTLVEDD